MAVSSRGWGRSFVAAALVALLGGANGVCLAQQTAAITAGQDWLLSVQNGDGSFGGGSLAPRDSSVALLALPSRAIESGVADGIAYLHGLPASSNHFDSLRVQALAGNGESFTDVLEGLASYRNGEGMGPFGSYYSNFLDTALAIQALGEEESDRLLEIVELLDYLQASRNADGGWGFVPDSPSEIYYTAEILLAMGHLEELAVSSEVVSSAQAFLVSRQAADGSFGSSAETALAFRSLVASGYDVSTLPASPVDLLVGSQETDGSWTGDVFTTGQAVLALQGDAPNLIVSEVAAPSAVAVGDPIALTVTVRNVGTATAPASRVSILADSATSGDERATVNVPELIPGAVFSVDLELATVGEEGELVLVAVADADGTVSESREDDNESTVRVAISSRPDPAVFGSDLDVSPDQPRPGEPFDLFVSIRNLGEQEVETVAYRVVELVAGAPVATLAEGSAGPIGTGAAVLVTRSLSLPEGEHTLAVVLDPDDSLAEGNETNNTASTTFFVTDDRLPDLAIDGADLVTTLSDPAAGESVTLEATVRNVGAVEATATVSLYEGDPETGGLLASDTVTIAAGGSAVVSTVFTASDESVLVTAVADPEGVVAELSETNNQARRYLRNLPDLAIGHDNVAILPEDPLAGDPVTVSVTVRNAGTLEATNVPVNLYAGDPASGSAVSSATVPSIPPGGNSTVHLSWAADPGRIGLVAVADADETILELSETNNAATREVFVPRASGPDLSPRALDLSGLVHSATDLSITGTVALEVANTGDADVAESFVVRLFEDRDGDGRHGGDDRELASTVVSDPVPAGGFAPLTLSVDSVLAFHRSLVWVSVDATDVIQERNEADNRLPVFASCEAPVSAPSLTPIEKWYLPGIEVETAPVVVQLSDDNGDGVIDSRDTPDVVFHTEDAEGRAVYAVSGIDGTLLWIVRSTASNPLAGRLAHLAAADVNGDGVADVIAVRRDSRLVALSHQGEVLWVSDRIESTGGDWAGAPAIGDLSGDGVPEIVVGRAVLDNAGKLVAIGTGNRGRNHNYYGPWGVPFFFDQQLSIIADVDLDGRNELVAGDTVYRLEGGVLTVVWNHDEPDKMMVDGFSAVGNLDSDPEAEIVYASANRILVLDHDGRPWGRNRQINPIITFSDATWWNGAPAIADLDGDGSPEILVGSDNHLVAFTAGLGVKWKHPVDERSAMTGATAFDLDGDGILEVLYLDQARFVILDGATGAVRYSQPNRSKTATEYPVVADVDGDGSAEIILPSNRYFNGDASTQGLHVLGHPSWQPTRPIHNQHSYHVTNVMLDGTVPSPEAPSWQLTNSYRTNLELPPSPKYLPNLTVGLPRVAPATSDGVPVTVRVGNGGRTAVPAGVVVRLYDGVPASASVVGESVTPRALLPGQWLDLVVSWTSPTTGSVPATAVVDATGRITECDETDNAVGFELTETLLPDLEIAVGGVLAPSPVAAGQLVPVEITVANVGPAAAPETSVRLYDGEPRFGGRVGETTLPVLGAGAATTVEIRWESLGEAGTHNLHALVNEDGLLGEETLDNNSGLARVELVASGAADLSLESLGIDPASVAAGEEVLVEAVILNRGSELAGGFDASLLVNRAETSRVTSPATLGTGESTTVRFTLSTIGRSGTLLVEAVADPGNHIPEVSESNNRSSASLTVTASAVAVAVATDKASYRATETVDVSVGVSSSRASSIDGRIRVAVEDSTGAEIAVVAEAPAALPPGSSSFAYSWPTGAALPGPYAVAVTLDEDGTLLARGTTSFSIAADLSISAEVVTDRVFYEPHQTVVVTGGVRNESSSTLADHLTAQVLVLDPAGAEVSRSEIGLEQVQPGAFAAVGGTWDVGIAAPGEYRAEVRVLGRYGDLLALDGSAFTVEDSAVTGGGLDGDLVLSPAVQGIGAPVAVTYRLDNDGNADVPDLVVHLELLELATGEVVSTLDEPISLARGASMQGIWRIDTEDLLPGGYLVSFSGILGPEIVRIASESLSLLPGLVVDDLPIREGDAGATTAEVTVRLLPRSSEAVTVDFATADGSATAGEDYGATNGTLTFAPGETTKSISIAVFGDTREELHETFLVNLTDPSFALVADGQGVVTLEDEEGCASENLVANSGAEDESAESLLPGWVALDGAWDIGFAEPLAFEGSSYFAAGVGDAAELYQDVSLESFAAAIDGGTLELAFEGFVWSVDDARISVEYRDPAGVILDAYDSGPLATADQWMAVVDRRLVPAGARVARVRLLSAGSSRVAFDRVSLRSLGVLTLAATGPVLPESETAAPFQLRLSCASPTPVSLSYDTVNLEAVAGDDYVLTSGGMTLDAGVLDATLEVPLLDDSLDEEDERFALHLTSDEAIVLGSPVVAAILDDDGPVSVAVAPAAVTEGDSGSVDAVFLLSLSGPSGKRVQVDYATAASTAGADVDYRSVAGTAVFPTGETVREVRVAVNGDTVDELVETFLLRLSNPVHATLAQREAVGTIVDDDEARLSVGDVEVAEGDEGSAGVATLTVSLSVPSDRIVTASFATVPGSAVIPDDYQASSGTLTFPAGSTSQPISIQIVGDDLEEATETFVFELASPTNAELADPQATVTILDDDGPILSIDDVELLEGNSGSSQATFTVTSMPASTRTVSVDVVTGDGEAVAGEDFEPVATTLTFEPGETIKTVPVTVFGEKVEEPDERFFVRLERPVNAAVAKPEGVGTILDDDVFYVQVEDLYVVESRPEALLAFRLNRSSEDEIRVDWTTTDDIALAGEDYLAAAGTVVFPAGSVEQVASVTLLDDVVHEGPERFWVDLSGAVNAHLARSRVGVHLLDDEKPSKYALGTTIRDFVHQPQHPDIYNCGSRPRPDTFLAPDGKPAYLNGGTGEENFYQWYHNAPGVNQSMDYEILFAHDGSNFRYWHTRNFWPVDGKLYGNEGRHNFRFTTELHAWFVYEPGTTILFGSDDDGWCFVNHRKAVDIGWCHGPTSRTIDLDSIAANFGLETGETYRLDCFQAERGRFDSGFYFSTPLYLQQFETGTLEFRQSEYLTYEGTGSTNVHVERIGGTFGSVEAEVEPAGGTAIAGEDFAITDGRVTFASGDDGSKAVAITILEDGDEESEEHVELAISDPSGGALLSPLSSTRVRILDAGAFPVVRAPDVFRSEGSRGAFRHIYAVELEGENLLGATVQYSTRAGTALEDVDFRPASGSLVFAPGESVKHLEIFVIGDTEVEPDESFWIDFEGERIAGSATTRFTIVDDDSCVVPNLLRNGSFEEGLSNGRPLGWESSTGGWGLFNGGVDGSRYLFAGWNKAMGEVWQDVDLSGYSTVIDKGLQRIEVWVTHSSWSAENPMDQPRVTFEWRDSAGSILEFYDTGWVDPPSGHWLAFAPVVIPPEGTRTLRLRLFSRRITSSSSNAHFDFVNVRALGRPSVSTDNLAVEEGQSGSRHVAVPVRLSCPSELPVSLDFGTSDGTATAGSDYAAAVGSLLFEPGELSHDVPVEIFGDTISEGSETFSLLLRNPVNVGFPAGADEIAISIIDDESTLSIGKASGLEGNEGFTNLEFTVTLEPALNLPVTVDYATEDYSAAAGEDYVAISGTLTFEPGETTKVITVQAIGDTDVEDDEVFFVKLSNPNNAGITMGDGRGTIKHDDIFVTAADAQVIEGHQGTVDLIFEVELSSPSSQIVTVDYETVDGLAEAGLDYEHRSGTLTFPAGNTLATVTVPVFGDTIAEGSETFHLRLSNPVNSILLDPEESGTGFIVDDDDCGSPNLLRNPGAETPIHHVGVPEWVQVVGTSWGARSSSPSPFEGKSYFAPGNVGQAELRQDVDVSLFADAIDRGVQRFLFEGWVRSGNTTPVDQSRIVLEYRDSTKDVVLGSYDSGEVGSVTAWKNLADLEVAPVGTRWVRVRLLARRTRSSGFNSAYFDGLVLRSLGSPIFEMDDLEIHEGDTESVFGDLEVRLNCPAEKTVTVEFATADDTAKAGSDYVAASGTLTYAPGEISQTVSIEVLGDYFNERLETLFVRLSNPSDAVVMDDEAAVTLRDTDLASPPVTGQDFVYTLDEDFDLGFSVAVNHEAPNHDQLQLDEQSSTFPFIWVAASRKGTIVKIDTRSGEVLGEYSTNPDNRGNSNPSRTTVGLDGSVWVGNRNDSSATHIGLPELGQCVDRNGNGIIETSGGYNHILPWKNVGGPDTGGGVSTAADECILHYVKLPYSCTTRHVSVDRDGDVWLGCWGGATSRFALVDGQTGDIVRTTGGSLGCGGYGGLVDSNGILWSASLGSGVLRWDPAVDPPTAASRRCIGASGAYGVAVGPSGDIYVNDHGRNRIHRLDSQGSYVSAFPRGSSCGQGLVVDPEGDVWSSSSRHCSGTNVSHVKGDGSMVGTLINVPTGTTGMAVDSNGKVWAAADQASQVLRIDPKLGPIGADGVTPIGNIDLIVDIPGAFPYNYSDMTGSQLLRFTAPQGSWTVIQDAGLEGTEWGSLLWNTEPEASTPEGSVVVVEVRAADGLAGLGGSGWLTVENGVPFQVSGRFLQVRVTLKANGEGATPVFSDLRVGVKDAAEVMIEDLTVDEGAGLAELAVTLSEPAPRDVTLEFVTADGTAMAGADYDATSGAVTIPAGMDSVVVGIPIFDDEADEPDETFLVTITEVTNGTIADGEGVVTILDDDPLPLVSVGDVSVQEGDEGTTIASFQVFLSHPSFFPVAVEYATADGSARAGLDYLSASGTLVFPAGVTVYSVEVEVVGDVLDEFDETFFLRVSGSVYGVITDDEGMGTILDDDLPPVVTIDDVTVTEGDEGTVAAAFSLALSAPSGRELSVSWATVDGSATAGADYEAISGVALFPEGTVTMGITIAVSGDPFDEPDETFTVVLSDPVHVEIGDSAGLGTILDDDEPPTMTIGDASVHEGDSGSVEAVLPVELSQPSGYVVSVDFSTTEGTAEAPRDFLPRTDTLLIPPGTKAREIRIEVVGDRIDELDETFFVDLSSVAHAVLEVARGEATIVDDDEALMSIADVTVDEGDSGTADAVFPVTLAVPSDREITVDYETIAGTATEGEDYQAVSGQLVFEPLTTENEIPVPVLGDLILEPDEESFTVELFNVTNTTFADPTGLGTILDDEVCLGPDLLRNPGAEERLVDGEIPGWLEVEGAEWSWDRDGAVEAPEGVAYFTAGGPEYAELAQDVDVAAYAGRIATGGQAFAFEGLVRTLDEDPSDTARIVVEYRDESNGVVLDAFDTGDLVSPLEWLRVEDVRPAPVGTAVVRVRLLATGWSELGNDGYFDGLSLRSLRAATVTVGDVTTYEGDSGTHGAVFPVALACPFYQEVLVDYATADGTAVAGEDYVAAAGSLALPVGQTSAEVLVPVVGDDVRELHETFHLEIAETSATEAVLLDPDGLGLILDDDFCPRTQGFWKSHVDLWPTDHLVIGGVEYDVDGVLALLLYEDGDDMSHLLAKQLAATKLNLLTGSDPWIVPTIEDADAFLVAYPAGSDPRGEERAYAESLKDTLDRYNKKDRDTCQENEVIPGAGG